MGSFMTLLALQSFSCPGGRTPGGCIQLVLVRDVLILSVSPSIHNGGCSTWFLQGLLHWKRSASFHQIGKPRNMDLTAAGDLGRSTNSGGISGPGRWQRPVRPCWIRTAWAVWCQRRIFQPDRWWESTPPLDNPLRASQFSSSCRSRVSSKDIRCFPSLVDGPAASRDSYYFSVILHIATAKITPVIFR